MKSKLVTASIIVGISVGLFFFLTWPAFVPDNKPAMPAAAETVAKAQLSPPVPLQAPETPDVTPVDVPEAPVGNLFAKQEETWRKVEPDTVFEKFVAWWDRYDAAATPAEKKSLEAEGFALAKERRGAMKAMIEFDPERALALTVPFSVRAGVSPSVANLLEQQVSGKGDVNVLGVLAEPGKEKEVAPVVITATVSDKTYKAYPTGSRLGGRTHRDIPLNGVAVDDALALSENPVRVLEDAELASAKAALQGKEAFCAVSKKSANANHQELGVEVAGEVHFVCGVDHAKLLNSQLIAAANGGTGGATSSATIAGSSYTEGQKRLLLIRVDFPDLVGAPMSDSTGTNLINGLGNFYNEMSYGRASFAPAGSGSDLTPTFRMPNNASYYGTNNYYDQLRADARNAAAAAGYAQANYDFDVTCIGAVPGFNWSGLGYVGAPGAWVRSAFSGPGVAGHELGHNFGLNHANFWDTSGQSTIGPGTSVEYGDIYDTMGNAVAGNNHFNSRYKNYLNWLRTNEVVTFTTNGTYRVYTHDDPTATGIRGLKIVRDASTNYWVELRQKFTGNKWMMNGAELRWTGNSNERSMLLDFAPGTPDGKNDCAIPLGRTFADTARGIYITALGKGGTVPESLDVTVYKGTFSTNLPPTVTVSASSTNPASGSAITLSASASDPNADALTYFWDFGDGTFTNGSTATKSWTTGEYVARCVVSDFRGGEAIDSVIITVGSPTTFRISGVVTDGANPVKGVLISTGSKITYTDSDGTYNLVGLASGSYTVSASLYGYTFVPVGFNNPVVVGPSQSGISFNNSFTDVPPQITSQPQSQSVNVGGTAIFSVGATGTNLRYQWRFNNGAINNATNSSYLLSNVQAANAGSYSVTVTNTGGSVTSSTALLTVTDNPTLAAIANATVNELSTLSFTASAAGNHPPFTYSLVTAPSGATIDPTTGAFSWTPTEAQGPGTYSITVRATDSNVPAGTDSKTFTVSVKEVNQAPTLNPISNYTVKYSTTLSFTATASDPDLPTQALAFSLVSPPSGATIGSSSGVFKWTPKKNQVGTFNVTAKVTDNGSPVMNSTKSFTITVTK